MGKIIAIGLNTFRESVRDKIFYSLIAFAMLLLGFSVVLGKLSLGDVYKIIQDFSLMAISLFGTLTAIFVGIGMVYKEMDKRTIYVILSKPVARWQFLLGKYGGLTMTLLLMEAVMSLCLFAVCYLYLGTLPFNTVFALIPIVVELQLILAAALLFSTFSTPFLSGMFTLAIFIIGHISVDLKVIADKLEPSLSKTFINGIYYILPNLERLNYKAAAVHHLQIAPVDYISSLIYGLVYTVIIILGAVVIFNHRNMK